jgi:hypothetical protein
MNISRLCAERSKSASNICFQTHRTRRSFVLGEANAPALEQGALRNHNELEKLTDLELDELQLNTNKLELLAKIGDRRVLERSLIFTVTAKQ